MRRIFWHWAISAIILLLAAYALKPHVEIYGFLNALWVAPLLGLVNAVVGFVAGIIKLVAFPVNALTLGCFGFVVSFFLYSATIYLLMHKPEGPLSSAMSVENLLWAMALAALMALVSTVLNMVLPGKSKR